MSTWYKNLVGIHTNTLQKSEMKYLFVRRRFLCTKYSSVEIAKIQCILVLKNAISTESDFAQRVLGHTKR